MKEIYKIAKNFIGSALSSDLLFTYNNGFTTMVLSDGTGLLFYRFPNYYHEDFKISFSQLQSVLKNKKSYDITVGPKEVAVYLNRDFKTKQWKTQEIIKGLPAGHMEFPDLPRKKYDIILDELVTAYKKIAFFNSAQLDRSDVLITGNQLAVRNHTSEIVTEFKCDIPGISLNFMNFAHAIKALSVLKPDKITFGFSHDLYISADNIVAIVPYKRSPIEPVSLKQAKYLTSHKFGFTDKSLQFIIKHDNLMMNGAIIGKATGVINKVINKDRFNRMLKKFGFEYDLYQFGSSLIFATDDVYVIYY